MNNVPLHIEDQFRQMMTDIRSHQAELAGTTGNYTVGQDIDAVVALFNHAPTTEVTKAAEALRRILHNMARRLEDRRLLIGIITNQEIFPRRDLLTVLGTSSMSTHYRVLLSEMSEGLSPEEVAELEGA